MEKPDILLCSYALITFVLLTYTLSPGVWVTDESTYLLMVKSFAVDGSLEVWNGFDEIVSSELWLPGMQLVSNGEEVRMYGIPAPLYPLLVSPVFNVLGVWGLNLVNVVAFCLSVVVVYRLSLRFMSKKTSVLAGLFYSLTYAIGYSQMLWPHMVSVLIVLSSAYLILRYYLSDATGPTPLFLAGLLSGLAVGVRYPNAVFTAVALLFLWFTSRQGIKPFATGLMLPAAALSYLHVRLYGSILETSYPSHVIKYLWMLLAASTAALLAVEVLGKKGYRLKASHLRYGVVGFALVLLVLSFSSWGRDMLLTAYAKLFDMSHMPDYPGLYKKALLQSVPAFALAAFAPYLMWKKDVNKNAVLLLSSLVLAEFMLTPFTSMGGLDETYGMRYLLESVPFLAVLSMYSASVFLAGVKKKHMILSFMVFVVFTAFMLSSGHRLYSNAGLHRTLPLLLAVSLFVSSAEWFRDRRVKLVLLLFLALSAGYSASVGYADLKVMKLTRDVVWGTSVQLLEGVEDDSVIVYANKQAYPYVVLPKVYKRVRLVSAYADGGADLPAVLDYYAGEGKKVYVSNMLGPAWYNATMNYAVENNMSNMFFLNYEFRNPVYVMEK